MNIDGKHYRTIWLNPDGWSVEIIDQTRLPFAFETVTLKNLEDAARAISNMQVRGAPLIGATAAYGVCLGLRDDQSEEALDRTCETLAATRPTAINLRWALDEMRHAVRNLPREARLAAAYTRAAQICDEDVETNGRIGEHGLGIIRAHAEKKKGETVNILTHCNAGWLACVDWGTALAPIYRAHDEGIPVHVWVDETGRAIRAPRSPPSSSGRTACRTRLSPTTPAAISCRRSSSISASSAPTAPRRPATSPTRSVPISRRSPPATTTCPSLSHFLSLP
jgi:methylthioribose-1-phosphate isomerase